MSGTTGMLYALAHMNPISVHMKRNKTKALCTMAMHACKQAHTPVLSVHAWQHSRNVHALTC